MFILPLHKKSKCVLVTTDKTYKCSQLSVSTRRLLILQYVKSNFKVGTSKIKVKKSDFKVGFT